MPEVVKQMKENKEQLMDQYTDRFLLELQNLKDQVAGDDDIDSAIDAALAGEGADGDQSFDAFSKQWLLTQLAGGLLGQKTFFDIFSSEEKLTQKQQKLKEKIKNYLTNEWLRDLLEDKIINKKIFDMYLSWHGEKWDELFANLQQARELFVWAETMEDLKILQQELNLYNEDVDVADADFYQDNPDHTYEAADLTGKEQQLFSSITSKPLDWNRETWVTWCSYTARLNAENFGIQVPSGNAFDAKDKNPTDNLFVESVEKEKDEKLTDEDLQKIDSTANFADVYVYSQWKYAKYGHRCSMFKNNTTGKWFVLDPYRQPEPASKDNPDKSSAIKPKPLEDYLVHNAIAKINFYNSPVAVVDQTQQVA